MWNLGKSHKFSKKKTDTTSIFTSLKRIQRLCGKNNIADTEKQKWIRYMQKINDIYEDLYARQNIANL